MYKNITNDSPAQKSLVCSQVEEGKIPTNQLLCCYPSNNSCSSNPNNLADCYFPNQIAKCNNISTFPACQRTDANALRVCEWQNGLFCLSGNATSGGSDSARYAAANKWAMNRSTVAESGNNVMACDNGQNFQLCNSNGNLVCGDMFQSTYECIWNDNSNFDITPTGEVCEIEPTVTVTAKSTVMDNSTIINPSNDRLLAIGLGASGFGLAVCLAVWVSCLTWKLKKINRIG